MTPRSQRQVWSDELERDAVRLVAFQRWLASELGERLVWPADPAKARRQIGQVRVFIERAVADLGKHGFLFRPADLETHITGQLDAVAKYQRAGHVRDLYAYLSRTWDGWVGRNAERLAAEAKAKDTHRANIAANAAPSIAELVLRDLEARHEAIKSHRRFRASVKTARQGPCKADAGPLLPGFPAG